MYLLWIIRRLPYLQMLLTFYSIYLLTAKSPEAQDKRFCFANHSLLRQRGVANLDFELVNILSESEVLETGKNIFFHDINCKLYTGSAFEKFLQDLPALLGLTAKTRYAYVRKKQACAIESAAKHHPNHTVMVAFACADAWHPFNADSHLLRALKSYTNIRFSKLDVWSYAVDTPLEQWLHSGHLFRSMYLHTHMPDLLRFLTLWRWGGLCLDLDVVVLKTLATIEPNFVGKQTQQDLNPAVLHLGGNNLGLMLAEECLRDFRLHFSPNDWNEIGPEVITRVLKSFCKTSDAAVLNTKRCFGFKVLPPEAFYAIHGRHLLKLYERKNVNATMEMYKNAYVAHVWHSALSGFRRLPSVNNDTAYGQFAAKNCPKVYAATKYEF